MFKRRIITFYTLRCVGKPLLLAFVVGMSLVTVARVSLIFNLTADRPDGVSATLRLLSLWLPHYLSLCIPVALFLGIMLGFKQMAEDEEIDVIQSIGVSLNQIFLPILFVSVALTIVTMIIIGWIEPYAKYAWKKFSFQLNNANVIYMIEDSSFVKIGNKILFIEDIKRNTGSFGPFFMYERGDKGFTVTTAHAGRILRQNRADQLRVQLDTVDVRKFDREVDPADPANAPLPMVSRSQSVERPVGDESRTYRRRGLNETEWTASEIIRAMLYGTTTIKPVYLMAELNYRLAKFIFMLIIPFFCFPFYVFRPKKVVVWRYGVPVIIIIVIYILLDQAKTFIKSGWPPLMVMWAPLGVLMAIIAYRYWKACFTVPRT